MSAEEKNKQNNNDSLQTIILCFLSLLAIYKFRDRLASFFLPPSSGYREEKVLSSPDTLKKKNLYR